MLSSTLMPLLLLLCALCLRSLEAALEAEGVGGECGNGEARSGGGAHCAAAANDELDLLQLSRAAAQQEVVRASSGRREGCETIKRGMVMQGHGADKPETFVPYFSNLPLDVASATSRKVTNAVILAQPYSSRPYSVEKRQATVCEFIDVVFSNHVENETLVIAPWFVEEDTGITSEQWRSDDNQGGAHIPGHLKPMWWKTAAQYTDGANDMEGGISTFEVFDKFVTYLQEDKAGAFPELQNISAVGFSGGGKVISRWSVFTDVLLPGAGRAKVTAVAGGSNNYMYLDTYRPAEYCRPMTSTQVPKCDTFETPNSTECANYNEYPLGLDVTESGYDYASLVTKNHTLLTEKIAALPKKSILFMVGGQDYCSCYDQSYVNARDCFHPWPICSDCFPDTKWGVPAGVVGGSCKKQLGGANRRQRLTNYMQYLTDYFNRTLGVDYKPKFATFPAAHHEDGFWRSPELTAMVWGKQK